MRHHWDRPWAGVVLTSFLLWGGDSASAGDLHRFDQPDKAQEHYSLQRIPAGETAIPVERYLAALEHMARMPQYSSARRTVVPSRAELGLQGISYAVDAASLGAWTELGPGNVGGRTRALVIHPRRPKILYAGAASGGVWRTDDGGASWRPLGDLLPNLAVNALAMDRRNPDVLYAGTGEGFFNFDQVRGAGVFRTEDGGESWTHLESTKNPDFHYVNDLVISPRDSRRIYAATGTGVLRSLDGGFSWTRVLPTRVKGGCLDLAIRTDQAADFLFAACGTEAQGTVYRNVKAEGNGVWKPVLRERGMGRTSLAIAPSNQKIVYALAASTQKGSFLDGLHAVFRSTSAGAGGTWKAQVRNSNGSAVSVLLLSDPRNRLCYRQADLRSQGWYDNVIAVDPRDPNRVWAGGIDLFRSDDGGRSWGIASYWWGREGGGPAPPSYVHADQHAFVFHPFYNGTTNRVLFVGNDGGIFRTDNARAATARSRTGACDPAATPFVWKSLNSGYAVTQLYHGVVLPDGLRYFGGTQDQGTILGGDAAGPDGWEEINGGDGGYVAVDPNDPHVMYSENSSLSIQKSTDGGESWLDAIDGIDEDSNNFLFIAPFAMDPSDPQRLWTGGSALWRTTDGASTWKRASDVLGGAGSTVSAIAIDPKSGDRVLAGTTGGAIHRATSALEATRSTAWPSARPRPGFVSSLVIDGASSKLAYATYATFGGSHVWKTMDGGVTWSAIDGEGDGRLPDVPAHSVAIDPSSPDVLYVGTDMGVFVTRNGGQSWMVENTGFANVVTEALQVHEAGGVTWLYAFTHGRGAWRVRLCD